MKLPPKYIVIGYYLPALAGWVLCLVANALHLAVLDTLAVWACGVLLGYYVARYLWDRKVYRAWKNLKEASEDELIKGHGYNALMLGSRCFAVGQIFQGKDPTELPVCPDLGCELCERDEPKGELQ